MHDLDEKVFASMQVFRGQSYATLKKTIAIVLWIVLSVVVAIVLACEYNDGSFLGTCKVGEYECRYVLIIYFLLIFHIDYHAQMCSFHNLYRNQLRMYLGRICM